MPVGVYKHKPQQGFQKGHPNYLFAHSEATKKIMSEKSKGNTRGRGNKGKPLSKEHIDKIRQTRAKNPVRYWLGKKNLKIAGKNNPNWKEDRSEIDLNKRRWQMGECVSWRKRVFGRDGFRCKISNLDCKGQLEAHHILSWRDHPELRFDDNNGITLCHFHHPRKRSEEIKMLQTFQQLVAQTQNV